MRIYRAGAALLVTGALTVALAACSSSGPVESTAVPTAARTTAPPAARETPTPAAEAGSRDQPYDYNKAVQYDSTSVWTFTWQSTKADGWPDIQGANQFNTAPAAGTSYVLGTLAFGAGAAVPTDGASPTSSWGVAYVGNDGNTYQNQGECGVLPGSDLLAASTMYANASQVGSVCAKVPTAAVAGGTWVIRSYAGADASVYFKGA